MIAQRLLAASVFLVVSLALVLAQAATELIQLVIAPQQSELVREAGVRLEAELSSLGFSVVRCELGDETGACEFKKAVGRLELEPSTTELHLRAYVLHSEAPLEQAIGLGNEETSAEVVAIRAVELLRGALLSSLRSRQVAPDQHSALARFTGDEALEGPLSEPVAAPAPVPTQPQTAAPERADLALVWSFHLGPLVYMTGQAGAPSMGFELASELSVSQLYLGFSAELAPFAGQVQQSSGKTDVHAYSGFARLGWNAPCGSSLDCKLGLAVGFQQLQFLAEAREGYVAANAHHESLALAGEAQLLWHWSANWGVFGLLRVGTLTDAPVLIGSDSKTMGRPFGSLAVGVSLRVE